MHLPDVWLMESDESCMHSDLSAAQVEIVKHDRDVMMQAFGGTEMKQ